MQFRISTEPTADEVRNAVWQKIQRFAAATDCERIFSGNPNDFTCDLIIAFELERDDARNLVALNLILSGKDLVKARVMDSTQVYATTWDRDYMLKRINSDLDTALLLREFEYLADEDPELFERLTRGREVESRVQLERPIEIVSIYEIEATEQSVEVAGRVIEVDRIIAPVRLESDIYVVTEQCDLILAGQDLSVDKIERWRVRDVYPLCLGTFDQLYELLQRDSGRSVAISASTIERIQEKKAAAMQSPSDQVRPQDLEAFGRRLYGALTRN